VADQSYIYAALAGNAGVQALLGTTPPRIYGVRVPESSAATTPYVVGHVISAVPENQLDGGPGVDLYRIQFDIIATTESAVMGVLTAMRAVLEPIGYELNSFLTVEETTDVRRGISDWNFWLAR
jgi:hypothetical protein